MLTFWIFKRKKNPQPDESALIASRAALESSITQNTEAVERNTKAQKDFIDLLGEQLAKEIRR